MEKLNELEAGDHAIVQNLTSSNDMKQRLWDLGFTVGTPVQCVQKSPAGDPVAYKIRSTIIAIRNKDAQHIHIKKEGMANG